MATRLSTAQTRFNVVKIYFLVLLLSVSCLAFSAPVLPPLNKQNTKTQIPGKFIWFELATTNPDQLQKFYGDVFGWQFQSITQTDEHYTIIRNGDRNVAGLFKARPREGVKLGALWIGMMSVDDPDKAAATAKKTGGSVHTPPKALPNRGTYALLRDPEGAIFGVLKSDSGDPPDRAIENGNIFWLDLFAKNTKRAGEFYKKLAGYDISSEDFGGVQRTFLWSAEKYRAGIVTLPYEANRSGWLPYVRVKNVEATLKKVRDAGGIVMVEPDKALLDGNLAIFSDPLGGIIGIVKWDYAKNSKQGNVP